VDGCRIENPGQALSIPYSLPLIYFQNLADNYLVNIEPNSTE
jgi:hypothetical protein